MAPASFCSLRAMSGGTHGHIRQAELVSGCVRVVVRLQKRQAHCEKEKKKKKKKKKKERMEKREEERM
ncbi:hypothetical protein LTR16_011309, partial [Cryomyces antarcticus]